MSDKPVELKPNEHQADEHEAAAKRVLTGAVLVLLIPTTMANKKTLYARATLAGKICAVLSVMS